MSNTPWICSNCHEHNSNVNDVCARCGEERSEGYPVTLGARIDNTLDELHDLLAVWKRWRDRQETPHYVRRAILMVIEEVWEAQVNQSPESLGAEGDSARAPTQGPGDSRAPVRREATLPAASLPPAGNPASAPDRGESEPGS
jgi:hypothetical protein